MHIGDVQPGEIAVVLAAYAAGPLDQLGSVGSALTETLAGAVAASLPPGVEGETITTYVLGTPTVGLVGELYKVCWGANPTPGSIEDYNVEIEDVAILVGPDVASVLACTMG